MPGDPFKDLDVGKPLSDADMKDIKQGRDPFGEGRNVGKEKKEKPPETETLPITRKPPKTQKEGTLALAKGGKPVGVGVAQRGFGAVRRARKGGKMC